MFVSNSAWRSTREMFLLFAGLALAGLLVACKVSTQAEFLGGAQAETQPKADKAKRQSLQRKSCEPWIGVVLPQGSVSVTAPIDGDIVSFFVEVGREVTERQPIAKLENGQMQYDLQIAEADRDLAKAELTAASSVKEQAEKNYRRRRSNPRAFSAEEIEKALRDHNASTARTNAATARVNIKTVELERKRALAESTEVLAPVDGVMLRRFYMRGDFITRGSTVAEVSLARSNLVRFAIPLEARSELKEDCSLMIMPDESSAVGPEPTSQASLPARLTRILPHLDQTLGNLIAEASLEPNIASLRAGQGVLVRLASCPNTPKNSVSTTTFYELDSDHHG